MIDKKLIYDLKEIANNMHEFSLLTPGGNYSVQVSTVIVKERTKETFASLPLTKYFQTGLYVFKRRSIQSDRAPIASS